MRWWNDLWLNEGFASYVSYLGADYAEPTWNVVSFYSLYYSLYLIKIIYMFTKYTITIN